MDSLMHFEISFSSIKHKIIEVIDDLKSCIVRVKMLKDNATNTQLLIYILIALFIFGSIIFRAGTQDDFNLQVVNSLLIIIITFITYCISDYFWFLKNKHFVYEKGISENTFIKDLTKKIDMNLIDRELTYQEQILKVTDYYTKEIKSYMYRFLGEVIILIVLVSFINPLFFYYNIALFFGMFVFNSLYEGQSTTQAFSDIILLSSCIKEFNEKEPKKCKSFIIKNKSSEVRNLKKIYAYLNLH